MGYHRLKTWLQNKVGIGENRDRLNQLEARVHALAALHHLHLPEVLRLPDEVLSAAWHSLPIEFQGAERGIHRSDPMLLYPLAVSGGDWSRCLTEYYQTGAHMAEVLRQLAPASRSVLDFGGGFGRVGRFLPLAFPDAARWVVDPKPQAVAFQEKAFGARALQTQTQVELVFAGSVFTHLQPEDARTALERIYQVLQPGGRAVLTAHIASPSSPSWESHPWTEETALPELEDSLSKARYSSVVVSDAAWQDLLQTVGFTSVQKTDARFGGTQAVWVARR
jgi:SAM-dependent methyltransferase